jgi:hypothetical protein
VQTLLAGAGTIGYGSLAGRGEHEQQQIARRLERRLPSPFTTIAAEREPVEVFTSGVTRATDSATAGSDPRPVPRLRTSTGSGERLAGRRHLQK